MWKFTSILDVAVTRDCSCYLCSCAAITSEPHMSQARLPSLLCMTQPRQRNEDHCGLGSNDGDVNDGCNLRHLCQRITFRCQRLQSKHYRTCGTPIEYLSALKSIGSQSSFMSLGCVDIVVADLGIDATSIGVVLTRILRVTLRSS